MAADIAEQEGAQYVSVGTLERAAHTAWLTRGRRMSSTGSSRGNPAMGDVLRSMAVIAAIVLALWGFGRLFTNTPESAVKTVDYASIVRSARPAAEFALLAPSSLPAGWKATSARFEPSSWHLGVLTQDEDYIGLEQTKGSIEPTVDRFAEGSTSAGNVTIDAEVWSVRTGPDGNTTFVRNEAGLTTLVTGTAPRQAVEAYVASLSAS